MISMRINGCLQMICKMLKRLLLSIGTPCLGSQGLGGGVVLAVDLVSHMFMYADIIIVSLYVVPHVVATLVYFQ